MRTSDRRAVNHLTSGGRVANISVATDESYLNKQTGERVDKTEWHRIVTFQDGLISMLEKHARKGRLVYIDGKLQTRRLGEARRGRRPVLDRDSPSSPAAGCSSSTSRTGTPPRWPRARRR